MAIVHVLIEQVPQSTWPAHQDTIKRLEILNGGLQGVHVVRPGEVEVEGLINGLQSSKSIQVRVRCHPGSSCKDLQQVDLLMRDGQACPHMLQAPCRTPSAHCEGCRQAKFGFHAAVVVHQGPVEVALLVSVRGTTGLCGSQ